MKAYFHETKEAREAHALYRELIKKHHPDLKGDEKTFIEIKSQWEYIQEHGYSSYCRKYDIAEGEHNFTVGGVEVSKLVDLIKYCIENSVIHELCGSWLWIEAGKEHREKLKEFDCKWSAKKKRWYFTEQKKRYRGARQFSMDEIRDMHGSKTYQFKEKKQIKEA